MRQLTPFIAAIVVLSGVLTILPCSKTRPV